MSPRVAQPWFSRSRIDDTITLLTEPYAAPFIRSNIWHVRGRDRDLVVDTGLGISSLREAAPELFDRAIVAVATHSHYDHVGGLYEFEVRAVHPLEADTLRSPNFAALRVDDFPPSLRQELAQDGHAPGGELLSAYPDRDFDPSTFRVRPVEPTWLVEEGDAIDLGDRAFEVLHVPGHSPGSIALWEAETGILFSGDVVYDGQLLDELPGSNIADYVASMERLRRLPVKAVHAGHYSSLDAHRFAELVDAYLQHASSEPLRSRD